MHDSFFFFKILIKYRSVHILSLLGLLLFWSVLLARTINKNLSKQTEIDLLFESSIWIEEIAMYIELIN